MLPPTTGCCLSLPHALFSSATFLQHVSGRLGSDDDETGNLRLIVFLKVDDMEGRRRERGVPGLEDGEPLPAEMICIIVDIFCNLRKRCFIYLFFFLRLCFYFCDFWLGGNQRLH